MRKEAKIDGRVAQWFQDNYSGNVLLEVKMEGGKLAPHQKNLLADVSLTHQFKYKFPDGARRTPLDYVVLNDVDAVMCVCTGDKCVCLINGVDTLEIKV